MNRAVFKLLIVVLMLSSFLGQAAVMSANAQVIAHALEHGGISTSTLDDVAFEIDAFEIHVFDTVVATLPHDDHAAGDVDDDTQSHGGRFGDIDHHCLHAAHPLPLVTAPEIPIIPSPLQELAQGGISLLPRLTSPLDPLFRPPRLSFAS